MSDKSEGNDEGSALLGHTVGYILLLVVVAIGACLLSGYEVWGMIQHVGK